MTSTELNQVDHIFIEAGKLAFSIGVPLTNNPYRKVHKLQKLWSIGHKKAYKEDQKKRVNGKYKIYLEPIITNPMCVKCEVNVTNDYCSRCGDFYPSTEIGE